MLCKGELTGLYSSSGSLGARPGRDKSVRGGGPGDVSKGQVLEGLGHGASGLQVVMTVFKEGGSKRKG